MPRWPLLITTIWIALLAAGAVVLAQYSVTPGATGEVPARWPDDASIARNEGGPTLMVFAHPRCPCTPTTVHEIAPLIGDRADVDVRLINYAPDGAEDGWLAPLRRTHEASLRDAAFLVDREGRIAARFGVMTSGHVLLYDGSGGLVFSGGVTSSRGHAGPNSNLLALERALAGDPDARSRTPVFGCPILETDDYCLAQRCTGDTR